MQDSLSKSGTGSARDSRKSLTRDGGDPSYSSQRYMVGSDGMTPPAHGDDADALTGLLGMYKK